jgi:hypothetical protein
MSAFDDLEQQIAALECCDYHSQGGDDFSENGVDPLAEFMARVTPAPPQIRPPAATAGPSPKKQQYIMIDLTSDDGKDVRMESPKKALL